MTRAKRPAPDARLAALRAARAWLAAQYNDPSVSVLWALLEAEIAKVEARSK